MQHLWLGAFAEMLDLPGMLQESEGLSRDLQQVVADRQRLAREVAIKAEMETQYAKRGTLQVG